MYVCISVYLNICTCVCIIMNHSLFHGLLYIGYSDIRYWGVEICDLYAKVLGGDDKSLNKLFDKSTEGTFLADAFLASLYHMG